MGESQWKQAKIHFQVCEYDIGVSMSEFSIEKIIALSFQMRKAIEICKSQLFFDPRFPNFPHGCCGDASAILSYYFSTHGICDFDYVSGLKGFFSHAWLENNSIIVDITSDQFSSEFPAVYVGSMNAFYESYNVFNRHPGYTSLDMGDGGRLARVFNILKKYLY